MLTETGKVISVQTRSARVALAEHAGCAGCAARKVCRLGSEGEREIEAGNEIGAQLGDTVVVVVGTSYALGAAVVLFGVPVLLGLAGVIMGSRHDNVMAGVFGLGGIIVGLALAKIVDSVWDRTEKAQPKIVEITSRCRGNDKTGG
jgi:positive regulator of sigma E activity